MLDLTVENFLPDVEQEQWLFTTLDNSPVNNRVLLSFVVHQWGTGTVIELNHVGGRDPELHFDRMGLLPGRLEFSRIRWRQNVLELRPPLVGTLDTHETTSSTMLSPVGYGSPFPCTWKVTNNKLSQRAILGSTATEWEWEFFLDGDMHNGIHLYLTFRWQAGVGLVEYRCSDTLGTNFGCIRYVLAGTPHHPPLPPANVSIPSRSLFGLAETNTRTFLLRPTQDGTNQMLCTAEAAGQYAFEGGMTLLPSRIVADSSGLRLKELNVWGQSLPIDPPQTIAGSWLNLPARPAFQWSAPGQLSIVAPVNRPVKTLILNGVWSETADDIPWSATAADTYPGNKYANLAVQYLRFEINATDHNGTPIPKYQEVLALHEPVGPIRVATRNGDDPPIIWDMIEYPRPDS